ncbi:hypothetical protein [Paenibacillus phytorum]|nr:hypothetical protein [Paenibacillus phytorum]
MKNIVSAAFFVGRGGSSDFKHVFHRYGANFSHSLHFNDEKHRLSSILRQVGRIKNKTTFG